MLHEVRMNMYRYCTGVLTSHSQLTHNVHGPHDDKFYKFLSGLEDEYDALRRSGYAGEGFHSEGKRLGASVSHDLPPHLARQKAAEAAEKRKQIGAVLQGSGRLGGAPRGNKSPRELAAEVRRGILHSLMARLLTNFLLLPRRPQSAERATKRRARLAPSRSRRPRRRPRRASRTT